MNLLENLSAAKKLPIGHYGRKEAEEKVQKEYQKCCEQERDFYNSLFRKYKNFLCLLDLKSAQKISDFICEKLVVKRIKKIVINSKDVHDEASAHYVGKYSEIHFKYDAIYLMTLLHEISHHVSKYEKPFLGGNHGETFCMIELFVFEAMIEFIEVNHKK